MNKFTSHVGMYYGPIASRKENVNCNFIPTLYILIEL